MSKITLALDAILALPLLFIVYALTAPMRREGD